MPLRILHVLDSLGKGGLENGLVNLIDRLDPLSFEHSVLTMSGLGPNADRLPGHRVRVECLAKDPRSKIHVAKLASAIRRFKPDIVHSRNWSAIEAVPAGRWVGSCALVHSEHGLESNASQADPFRRTLFRRVAFELAHRVLSVSYQLRDLHARRTGFPARRIEVIHNGVDNRRFFADPGNRGLMRQELGVAEGEFCIGCVGSLFPIKSHITMLKALESAELRSLNWRLLLIGEGPEAASLRAFVVGHPEWNGKVSFLGTSHRVPQLLNAMDVYVLPSISEGISNSLLEAMASGLPVVATASGGTPEVVVDGESGLLFPVGDFGRLAEHLLTLATQPGLRVQLGDRAVRRTREEFSIDSMVRRYEQLYKSLTPMVLAPATMTSRA